MTATSTFDLVWEAFERGERPASGVDRGLTIDAGYRIQGELITRLTAKGERLAGWKVGGNSEAARRIYGRENTPFRGFLLESGFYPSGHVFAMDHMPAHVVVECELMFTISRRLTGTGVTRVDVEGAVGSVAPAIELPTLGRVEGIDLGPMIADNMHHWGYVVGDAITPYPRDLDLGDIEVTSRVDGIVREQGRARDIIDNQLDTIAWLAGQLSGYGHALEPGQRVISGACLTPATASRGEAWVVSYSGIGEVSVAFR